MDPFNLARFKTAQERAFETARSELRVGVKRSHWMWFIFPQLRGLGTSHRAQVYGIGSSAEAEAYLADRILGPRLTELFEITLATPDRTAHEIFGSPDDQKFRSCSTLFASLPSAPSVFGQALDRFFDGVADTRTLELLREAN